jgi:hypothetical protein
MVTDRVQFLRKTHSNENDSLYKSMIYYNKRAQDSTGIKIRNYITAKDCITTGDLETPGLNSSVLSF